MSKRAPFCKRIEVSGAVPVLSACPLCTLGIYVISYSQREKIRDREIIIFSGQRFQALFFIRMSLSLLASLFPSQTSFSLSSSIFLFFSSSHSISFFYVEARMSWENKLCKSYYWSIALANQVAIIFAKMFWIKCQCQFICLFKKNKATDILFSYDTYTSNGLQFTWLCF